jgi:hypothetical protein
VNLPSRLKYLEFEESKAKVGVAVVRGNEVTRNGESNRQSAIMHMQHERNCAVIILKWMRMR